MWTQQVWDQGQVSIYIIHKPQTQQGAQGPQSFFFFFFFF